MKISLIVSDLSSSGAGRWGGAVRPFLLSQALRQIGYEVEILGFCQDGSPINFDNSPVPIVAIPSSKSYPQFWRSAQKLLARITGDIIYAYKLKPTSFGLALLKKMQTGRPVFLDIDDWELSWHGGDNWKYRPTVKQFAKDLLKADGALRQPDHPFYLNWIEKWVSKADRVTLHTRFLRERFGGIYVPNGKDTKLFDPANYDPDASRNRYGLSGYRVLMFPGAPRPYKGVEDVLTALDLLDESDLRLAIVGGSPYDDYDAKLNEKWGRWIVELPNSPPQMMPEIVSAAHLVVVPQRDHPATRAQFPLKLTDGMAMAKPVLATRVGDIPEILGETGYLVDPSSPRQIAAQIQWIFNHLDDANALGIQARARCVKHYGIERMSEILSEVIEKYRSSHANW